MQRAESLLKELHAEEMNRDNRHFSTASLDTTAMDAHAPSNKGSCGVSPPARTYTEVRKEATAEKPSAAVTTSTTATATVTHKKRKSRKSHTR